MYTVNIRELPVLQFLVLWSYFIKSIWNTRFWRQHYCDQCHLWFSWRWFLVSVLQIGVLVSRQRLLIDIRSPNIVLDSVRLY